MNDAIEQTLFALTGSVEAVRATTAAIKYKQSETSNNQTRQLIKPLAEDPKSNSTVTTPSLTEEVTQVTTPK